jgi:FkbM family methyltransferase
MTRGPLATLRSLRRRFTPRARLVRHFSPYLADALCVDVGASYYPHPRWFLFLESPATQWVAVEPNSANLGYIDTWQWASKVTACTTGLSREGGTKTLYVTNVDSGSSLLEPEIPSGMQRRITNLDYFFPLQQRSIQTVTLTDVIESQPGNSPVFVKLDTQGTELAILSAAEHMIRERRIIGIEMEASLLAQPVMRGSGKFWQANEYLEGLGLELLVIHPIYGPSRYGVAEPRGLTYLNECDAVFAIRQDIAAALPVAHRVTLLGFYLCNRLYEEALAMLKADAGVMNYLAQRGCQERALISAIGVMR